MKKFANKTAYATGGAAGIGKVVSLGLAKEGMDVAIVDVDLEGARKVSKEIEEMGRRSLAIQCDVTSEEGVQKMVDTIVRSRLETQFLAGWPGSDVIPNGCQSQFGGAHVDTDHPAAA